MAKPQNIFVCENCGNKQNKWVGKCPVCGQWNTYVQEDVVEKELEVEGGVLNFDTKVRKFSEIENANLKRIETNFREFDRVLGGGFVDSQVLLLAGEPGVGKSTFLLQVLGNLSKALEVLYISGEESATQVALRAKRLSASKNNLDKISFLGNSDVAFITSKIKTLKPKIVVIDSIQTVVDRGVAAQLGSVSQVRSCTAKLTYLAKSLGFILILVGHINKEGLIAGPKTLEHIVDCVLQFEGDSIHEYRILRSLKNRYGPSGEVGILVMEESGLRDIDLKDNLFSISSDKSELGVAKSVVVEGNRPIILDIQILSNNSVFPYPKRLAEGVSNARFELLCAIVENSKVARLSNKDVYLRVSGGYKIKDNPFCDLSIVAALVSSVKGKPISGNYVFLGEVSLNGKVFVSPTMVKVFGELARLSKDYIFVTSSRIKANVPVKLHKSFVFIENVGELTKVL